jgi:hypothetical protein
MTTVVQFEHRGHACAIPASQARAVDAGVTDVDLTPLWEGRGTSYGRAIEFRAKDGGMWIGCGEPKLCELPRASAMELPPLLRRILASLPHVVGMAILDGRHTWLVDLERFEAARPEAEVRR